MMLDPVAKDIQDPDKMEEDIESYTHHYTEVNNITTVLQTVH